MSTIREKIFASDDRKSKRVHVPEWDVTLKIVEMSGAERGAFLDAATADDGTVDLRKIYAGIVIATAYDPETGAKVFEDSDFDNLNEKNGLILERLANISAELSALDQTVADALGKDSSSTQSDDSPSN